MANNIIQWSQQEHMMAGAYANIASSFSQITTYMKNHLKTVKNGGGIITDGDIEEVVSMLSDMINKNLHNVSQKKEYKYLLKKYDLLQTNQHNQMNQRI